MALSWTDFGSAQPQSPGSPGFLDLLHEASLLGHSPGTAMPDSCPSEDESNVGRPPKAELGCSGNSNRMGDQQAHSASLVSMPLPHITECSSARARSVLQHMQSRSSRCQRKAPGAAVSTCSALGSLTDRTSVHLFMPHLLKIWNQQGIALPGDIGFGQEGVLGKL